MLCYSVIVELIDWPIGAHLQLSLVTSCDKYYNCFVFYFVLLLFCVSCVGLYYYARTDKERDPHAVLHELH